MHVKVKYLHRIAADMGTSEEVIELGEGASVADLLAAILARVAHQPHCMLTRGGDGYHEGNVKIALQREGVIGAQPVVYARGADTQLEANDTVILFQPIVGG